MFVRPSRKIYFVLKHSFLSQQHSVFKDYANFPSVVQLFHFCFFVVSQFTPVHGSLAATHLLVTHVGPCDESDVSVLPMTLREFTITTQTYDSSLSGEFNLTQDLDNGWKVKVG